MYEYDYLPNSNRFDLFNKTSFSELECGTYDLDFTPLETTKFKQLDSSEST